MTRKGAISNAETIQISRLRLDGETQCRVKIDSTRVALYAKAWKAMRRGRRVRPFPKIMVFYDGVEYWLADGFHRVYAATKAGMTEIPATIRGGTQRDAIWYALGANEEHGLPRTLEDKKNALMIVFRDEDWRSRLSLREIASHCRIDRKLVATVWEEYQQSLAGPLDQLEIADKRIGKDGKSYPTRSSIPKDTTPSLSIKVDPERAAAAIVKAFSPEQIEALVGLLSAALESSLAVHGGHQESPP